MISYDMYIMIYTRTDDLYLINTLFVIILRTVRMYTLAYYFIHYLYIFIYIRVIFIKILLYVRTCVLNDDLYFLRIVYI